MSWEEQDKRYNIEVLIKGRNYNDIPRTFNVSIFYQIWQFWF